jgi:hypothetical protein
MKTIGEVRKTSDDNLLSLQDLRPSSISYLRESLGLPSTDGSDPRAKSPPETREKGPARVQIEAEPSRAALKFGVNASRHSNCHPRTPFPESTRASSHRVRCSAALGGMVVGEGAPARWPLKVGKE